MPPAPLRLTATRLRSWLSASLLVATAAAAVATDAPAQAATSQAGVALSGVVVDSGRRAVLVGAVVQLEPTGRETITDSAGRYRFTGVVPGQYTLRALHPRLDTLGVSVVTPAFRPDGTVPELTVDIAIPTAAQLVSTFCQPAQLLRGPAVLVGFVRDPDTELPVAGARISLVFEVNRDPLGLVKEPAVRQAASDATGHYRICGLPATLNGKLQIDRGGVTSAEIPVAFVGGTLEARGLSFSLANTVVRVNTDSGKVESLLTGPARLSGRVLNRQGQPIEGARVTVVGSNSVVLTRAAGIFALDSLPVGSQVIQVRKLGYNPSELPVELSGVAAKAVDVTLEDFIPTLDTVRTLSITQRDLEKVGFTRRRNYPGGYHVEGERVNRHAETFSQSLIGIPSLKVVRSGEWQDRYVIQDPRTPSGGCVIFFVDGAPWKSLTPGDIDDFVRPHEVQALEIYRSTMLPPEFSAAGAGKCVAVVVWTKNRVRGGR